MFNADKKDNIIFMLKDLKLFLELYLIAYTC